MHACNKYFNAYSDIWGFGVWGNPVQTGLLYLNFDYISKPLEKISLHILIFDDVLCVANSVGTKFKFIDKLWNIDGAQTHGDSSDCVVLKEVEANTRFTLRDFEGPHHKEEPT